MCNAVELTSSYAFLIVFETHVCKDVETRMMQANGNYSDRGDHRKTEAIKTIVITLGQASGLLVWSLFFFGVLQAYDVFVLYWIRILVEIQR